MASAIKKKWSDFAPYLDKYMSRLAPADRATYDAALAESERLRPAAHAEGGESGPAYKAWNQARINAQWVLVDKLGASPREALSVMGIQGNLAKNPDGFVDYRNPKEGMFDIFPGQVDPSKFANDESYVAALLGAAGLPTDYWTTPEEKAAQTTADAAATQETVDKNSASARIQRFIDSMTGPSAPNDPTRLALIQAGTDAAQASAGRAGVRGTLAGTQAASMAQQNLAPYEAQRASMAAQGLGMLSQNELGAGQLALGEANLVEQARQNRQARMDAIVGDQYRAAQQGAQQRGAAIGTVIGAIGGLATGGGLAAAGMGAQFGGSLGAGTAANAGAAPQYKPSATPTYKRGSGLGSGGIS